MADKYKVQLIENIIEDYFELNEITEISKDYLKAIINNIFTIVTFSEKVEVNKILNE